MSTGSSIRGVSQSSLWDSWKQVRKQLKKSPRRDVLDYLEYDIDPNVWINRLLKRLRNGEYSPEKPIRFSVAKSKGFSRVITVPSIPDLVLYRTIVDYLFHRAKKKQKKHVYFCQSTLSKVVDAAGKSAQEQIESLMDSTDYPSVSHGAFLEWMKFDQYRKLLIFDEVYPFIVVTDITNFFDSLLYGRIEESLHELSAPSRMISLMFTLLESLSIRERFTPVQRIGLPVDPCDCSRNLAHMALFPHDDRIVDIVGEDAYVRWMDDQNMGVQSKADGLRILAEIDQSLRRLHLTPNSGKSKILSLREARVHFHFETNEALDAIDKLPFKSRTDQRKLRKVLNEAWENAVKHEGKGEWQKILKRFYRYAARARTRMFRRRAINDIKEFPALCDRIADYMRYNLSPNEYLDFIDDVLADAEQIYADVNYQILESLLKLEPEKADQTRLRELAQSIHHKRVDFPGIDSCRVLAPLMLLRYGTKTQVKALAGKLGARLDNQSAEVTRSICAILSSFGDFEFHIVQEAASRLLRNHLSEFVKMVSRIKNFKKVEGRFKARINISYDSIASRKYIDMRTLLAVRLLGLADCAIIKKWLADKKATFLKDDLSDFDKKLIARLWP